VHKIARPLTVGALLCVEYRLVAWVCRGPDLEARRVDGGVHERLVEKVVSIQTKIKRGINLHPYTRRRWRCSMAVREFACP
jgi:hypothetical protein